MSGSLTHSQAEVVQYLLADLGHGILPSDLPGSWPIYALKEVDTPDDLITVYDTVGRNQGKTQFDGEVQEMHGVQIRIRAALNYLGRRKAREIQVGLDPVRLKNVTVESSVYLVHSLSRSGDVNSLGNEPNTKRELFTVNFLVALRQVS